MKTTLDLPDELMRALKTMAAQQDRRLKDVIAEVLRRGLAEEQTSSQLPARRVRLPMVQCAHPARAGEELTPARVAELLSDDETRWALGGEHGSAV
jgi:plasmid stability protein